MAASQQQAVRAYDGPGDSSHGAPPSSTGSQGRGRPGSTAPPSVGQPSVRSPSRGPPSVGIRSPSHGRAPSQVRGTSANMLPDRTALMDAARRLDLPGNAYTFGNPVSRSAHTTCPFSSTVSFFSPTSYYLRGLKDHIPLSERKGNSFLSLQHIPPPSLFAYAFNWQRTSRLIVHGWPVLERASRPNYM